MFSGAWLAAVVFGIGLLGGGLTSAFAQNSSEQTVSDQPGRDGQQEDGNQSAEPFSFPVRILEGPKQTESAKRQEEESAQREIDDLVAQEGMNESTKRIVALTLLQTVLAFFGTIALIYSLHLNRKATHAATTAALAAEKAIHSDRAWMTVSSFNAGFAAGNINGAPIEKGIVMWIEWINTGRSPALRPNVFFNRRFVGQNESTPVFDAGSLSGESDASGATIGPGQTGSSGQLALNDDEAARFMARETRLFVYSTVTYFDIFNNSQAHFTEVCGEVEYQGMQIVGDDMIPRVGILPRGPQNSAT